MTKKQSPPVPPNKPARLLHNNSFESPPPPAVNNPFFDNVESPFYNKKTSFVFPCGGDNTKDQKSTPADEILQEALTASIMSGNIGEEWQNASTHHQYINNISNNNNGYYNDQASSMTGSVTSATNMMSSFKTSSIVGYENDCAAEQNCSVQLQSITACYENDGMVSKENGSVKRSESFGKQQENGSTKRYSDGTNEECEEQLRAEWKEALQYTTDLKRSVADLARQEEEAYREVSSLKQKVFKKDKSLLLQEKNYSNYFK